MASVVVIWPCRGIFQSELGRDDQKRKAKKGGRGCWVFGAAGQLDDHDDEHDKFDHGPSHKSCACLQSNDPLPRHPSHTARTPVHVVMKPKPYDEPAGKPTLRRPASGGGIITSGSSSKTKSKKALSYSRAHGKGGMASPVGGDLRSQRQQHQHRSLWMACARCLCGGKRAEEWGSKLRLFLVGELPASLSLPTKIRIVLEVRARRCVWFECVCRGGGVGMRG